MLARSCARNEPFDFNFFERLPSPLPRVACMLFCYMVATESASAALGATWTPRTQAQMDKHKAKHGRRREEEFGPQSVQQSRIGSLGTLYNTRERLHSKQWLLSYAAMFDSACRQDGALPRTAHPAREMFGRQNMLRILLLMPVLRHDMLKASASSRFSGMHTPSRIPDEKRSIVLWKSAKQGIPVSRSIHGNPKA